jgi:hypothetical protein
MHGWQPRGLAISGVVFGRWLQPSGCQRLDVRPFSRPDDPSDKPTHSTETKLNELHFEMVHE